MATLNALITEHGVDVLEHLDRQVSIPVLDGFQCQGDVAIIPTSFLPQEEFQRAEKPMAKGGRFPVVRGESGGNTHMLLAADGEVSYVEHKSRDERELNLGYLTVAEGATAYLAHPEHGYNGVGPGTYVLRRQREQADEIRLVAD